MTKTKKDMNFADENRQPYTFDRVVRLLIGIIIIVSLFFLVRRLSAVLLPFFIGWVFAYMLNPIVDFFQMKVKMKNRMLAIITTLLLFVIVIGGVVMLLTPVIGKEVIKFSDLITSYTQGMTMNDILPVEWQEWLKSILAGIDFEEMLKSESVMNTLKDVAPKLASFVNSSVNFILGFVVVFLVFLYMFFLLHDFDKISTGMFNIIPPRFRPIADEVSQDVKLAMHRYFRGQVLVATCCGILMAIGLSIISFPLAIIFGLFVGVLNIVPYLQTISIPIAGILALLKAAETGQNFWIVVLGVAIVYIAVEIIQSTVLTPKIMGKITGLHPAIILLSLSVWGSLMGFIGMIIAIPLTTLVISYYKRFVLKENTDTIDVTKNLAKGPVPIEDIKLPEKDKGE